MEQQAPDDICLAAARRCYAEMAGASASEDKREVIKRMKEIIHEAMFKAPVLPVRAGGRARDKMRNR